MCGHLPSDWRAHLAAHAQRGPHRARGQQRARGRTGRARSGEQQAPTVHGDCVREHERGHAPLHLLAQGHRGGAARRWRRRDARPHTLPIRQSHVRVDAAHHAQLLIIIHVIFAQAFTLVTLFFVYFLRKTYTTFTSVFFCFFLSFLNSLLRAQQFFLLYSIFLSSSSEKLYISVCAQTKYSIYIF